MPAGGGRFSLAGVRHTGRRWQVFAGLTPDDAPEAVRDSEGGKR